MDIADAYECVGTLIIKMATIYTNDLTLSDEVIKSLSPFIGKR